MRVVVVYNICFPPVDIYIYICGDDNLSTLWIKITKYKCVRIKVNAKYAMSMTIMVLMTKIITMTITVKRQ